MLIPGRNTVVTMAAGIPIAAVVGLLQERLWIVGPAWIGAVLLLLAIDAVLCRRAGAFTIVPDLPGVIEVGTPTALRFEIGGRPPVLEMVLEGDDRLDLQTVGPAAFTVLAHRRGTARLRRLHLRWSGPLRLVRRTAIRTLDHDILVFPAISRVRDEATRWFTRDRVTGRAPVHAVGEGGEFHALRTYQTGDNRRAINWRQSARHAELLVREMEDERNRTVILALDTGRLMSEPLADGMARLDHALHAALTLAFTGLRYGDRVGLYGFAGKPVLSSGTVSGPGAFGPLQRLAATLDYSAEETNFTYGLTGLAAGLSTRALVVVFTDFADTTGAALMLTNMARLLRDHVVIFVAMQDDALEAMADAPPDNADRVAAAVVAARLLAEREAVLMRLRRMGVDVLEAPARAIGSALIARYLDGKRRGLL